MAAAAACPWDVNVDQGFIHPIDVHDLPPKERERYMKDQRRKEKTITKQEVIEDLTYYIPDECEYDERDAPSAFSALFGKSSSSSTKSDDSKKSNKSVFTKFRKTKRRDDDNGGDWKKIP